MAPLPVLLLALWPAVVHGMTGAAVLQLRAICATRPTENAHAHLFQRERPCSRERGVVAVLGENTQSPRGLRNALQLRLSEPSLLALREAESGRPF